ncbi:sensor histidine kinase [Cohnella sp.]|uniref:sensor histidine kinase n=1 Tax=Cohnella sp. TaxID=1883426 RepID=UPI00356502C1
MLRWLRNVNIRNKIIFIYIPLVVIPLLVSGYVSNQMYTRNIVQKTMQSISDNSRLIVTRIDGIIQNAEGCANILTLNLNRLVQEEGQPTEETDPRYDSLLRNQLSFALLVFPDVDSAVFIDNGGKTYASHPSLEVNAHEYTMSDISKQLIASSGNNVWFNMQKRDFLTRTPEQTVLTLGKKVSDIETGKTLGWLILNIDENSLSNIFPSNETYQSEVDFLTDKKGTVVSSNETEALLKPVANATLRNWILDSQKPGQASPYQEDGILAVGYPLSKLNLSLISQVPIKELYRETDRIQLFILLLIASCLLLVLASAGLLSRTIASPIVRLTRTMRKVKEESLDYSFEVKGNDEIGMLGEGFNSMIVRIRELLNEIGIEQRQKREYELALIQAQIKPHFLYNTLDVIYALSDMGRTKDVKRTTKALADFYRIVLSKGQEIITLGEELQNVRDYLAIQRIRYTDVFDYHIEVPSELHSCAILKLTLQPLVENAIYHGLKPANRFGKLTITGVSRDGKVQITVKDDGIGMDETKLAELWKREEKQSSPSFGLHSVHQRLRLYFGEHYGVQINSQPHQGTEIIISLPEEKL